MYLDIRVPELARVNNSSCHAKRVANMSAFIFVACSKNAGSKNGTSVLVSVQYPVFRLWRYYCSESKPILYIDTLYCKFLLCVRVELAPKAKQQT